MAVTINGTTGIANDGGYTGDGVVFADTTPANTLVTTTGGNVGIGTSSPSSKFQVAGDVRINTVGTATTGLPIYAKQTNNDQRGIWTESATTDSNGRFYCDNSVVGIAASYSSTGSYLPITFTTSATERARINSSGDLMLGCTGISTDAPNVDGSWYTGSGNFKIRRGISGFQWFQFYGTSTGSPIGWIANSNNTGTTYNTASDYRLKHDIAPMTGALAKVAALKPCTYKWNADDSESQGFIAHELQEVVPECVTGEKDAVDADGNPQYQGIDTSFLVATLTAAIQELKAINDAQAETITALTARVTALEGA